jgi:putative spermidine/putrescine transport system permease protein
MVSMLVSRNVELYNQFGAASAVAVVLLFSVLVIFFVVSRFISLDRVLGQK